MERLVETLRLLAAPAEVQVGILPPFVAAADEIALLYGAPSADWIELEEPLLIARDRVE